ncbi:hypothetical protein IJM86_00500 [bacterium]|nr:hypothetical protein [bacterium]
MTILTIIGITCSENATFTESLDHIEKTSLSNTLSKKGYNDIETSNEWDLVMDLGSQYGYKLYKNGWCDDYLQKVNLSMGAKLQVGFGTEYPNISESSSPFFKKRLINSFWNSKPVKAISVTNCSFFMPDNGYDNEDSVRLSFPIKINGVLKSTGSDNQRTGKKKMGINFLTQEAWIDTFTINSNDSSIIANSFSSPTVIVGYSPETSEFSWSSGIAPTYRLMIGIKDQDGDIYSKNEVIYILSYWGPISNAKEKLEELGCNSNNIIMLDGSESSQMIAKNPDNSSSIQYEFNKDARTIPNVIYVCKP